MQVQRTFYWFSSSFLFSLRTTHRKMSAFVILNVYQKQTTNERVTSHVTLCMARIKMRLISMLIDRKISRLWKRWYTKQCICYCCCRTIWRVKHFDVRRSCFLAKNAIIFSQLCYTIQMGLYIIIFKRVLSFKRFYEDVTFIDVCDAFVKNRTKYYVE